MRGWLPIVGALSAVWTPVPAQVPPAPVGIGRIELSVEPQDARVSVDGQPVEWDPSRPLRLDAGAHTLTLSAPGYREETIPFDLTPAGYVVVRSRLRPLEGGSRPSPASARKRSLGSDWYLRYAIAVGSIGGFRRVLPFTVSNRLAFGWKWIGLDYRFDMMFLTTGEECGHEGYCRMIPVVAWGLGPRFEALPGRRWSPYGVLLYQQFLGPDGGGRITFGALGPIVGVRVGLLESWSLQIEGGAVFALDAIRQKGALLRLRDGPVDCNWHLSLGIDIAY